ncbi:hypothetical protein V512_006405 [Mesotoga sp. Brook.08.105.5.1]|uniref:Uncharacterized protein n=1 Tax=Mesotoga prima TaxID=1184387 RepID=A0A101HRP7_9BACT|nr:hypothetical protein [Mesotoga sp. Brook.08.105.5.1]KUK81649.1 MAG: Uncharacterized protein XD94_0372 [Mesotoga prima]PVD16555.1 hypothetical protein V512_006405 [Mesotoga sp. Brook.08.105.5.1]
MRKGIALTLLLLLVSVFAVADIATSVDLAQEIANTANEQIESLIEVAVEKAEKFTVHYTERGMSQNAYETLIDNLGNELASKALSISQDAIARIEELGYKAICYYVPVKLGYKVFLIDPILIIDD